MRGVTTERAQVRRMVPWLQKGTWTLLDQAFFSGANFAVNILLARWLSIEAYGAFAVAFTLFLLLATFHTGFLTEPMLVFAPERFRDRMGAYFRTLTHGHLGVSAVLSLLLVAAASGLALTGQRALVSELLILAAALPLILWMWLIRRACYARMMPAVATLGSVIYAVAVIAGVAGVHAMGLLSVGTAFAVVALASLISGIWIGRRVGVTAIFRGDSALRSEAAGLHWRYGRWASATGGLQWVASQLSVVLLPVFAGLAASADLKALLNLLLPAAHIYVALSMLMLPAFVRARREGRLRQRAVLATGLIVVAMIGYWLFLGLAGPTVMHLLYVGQYDGMAAYLWLAGAIPVVSAVGVGLAAVLRAMERPSDVFWAYVVASIFSFTVGAYLIWRGEVMGALLFHLSVSGVEVIVLGWLVARRRSLPSPIDPSNLIPLPDSSGDGQMQGASEPAVVTR